MIAMEVFIHNYEFTASGSVHGMTEFLKTKGIDANKPFRSKVDNKRAGRIYIQDERYLPKKEEELK